MHPAEARHFHCIFTCNSSHFAIFAIIIRFILRFPSRILLRKEERIHRLTTVRTILTTETATMKLSNNATIHFLLLATLSLSAEGRLGRTRGSNRNNEAAKTNLSPNNGRVLQVLEGFGSNPPDDNRPLQLCQGDCDADEDVSFIHFQTAPASSHLRTLF